MVSGCCAYNCSEQYSKGGRVTFHSEKFGGHWLKNTAVPTIFDFPDRKTSRAQERKVAEAEVPAMDGGILDGYQRDMSTTTTPTSESAKECRYAGDLAAEDMSSLSKGRRRKQLKTDEDEVIEYIEELEARKRLPKCVVCSRLLVNKKKEYLSTRTSTTGLSLHQCLIGISGDKSAKIKDCAASDVVCFYCAHLINYADKLEAELTKLKAAINGCLEIKSLSEEDQEMLKPQFDSHTAILDEFSERVVGPGSAAERGAVSDENPETGVSDMVIEEVISISVNPQPIQAKENIGNSIWKNTIKSKVERVKAHKPESSGPLKADSRVLICKICQLRTSSRSVLLFHLRRHMANYQWCDFCDKPLIDDDEAMKQKKVRDPT